MLTGIVIFKDYGELLLQQLIPGYFPGDTSRGQQPHDLFYRPE